MAFTIDEVSNILKSLIGEHDECITLQVDRKGKWSVFAWLDEDDCQLLAQSEPSIHWALVVANEQRGKLNESANR